MNEIVEFSNLLLQNSLLVKIIVFAIISEAIIYFGIRNGHENRLFYIGIFISVQIANSEVINLFCDSEKILKYIPLISGFLSIALAILIILSLNINCIKILIMKSRTLILMNGWDTLGKKASLASPVLIRITVKNENVIYGVFAQESNISFSNNREGIFLEKTVTIEEENLNINQESEGFWIDHSDIFMIELLKSLKEENENEK